MSIICLFFPAFIALKKSKKDIKKIYTIIENYIIYCLLINFFTMLIIRVFKNGDYIFDSNTFTVRFSFNYILVSCCIAYILPSIIKFIKANFSFKIVRKF